MSANRKKQRVSFYTGGKIFVIYKRWVWNCLPATQAIRGELSAKNSGRRSGNRPIARAAEENR